MERIFEIKRTFIKRLFCENCENVEMKHTQIPTAIFAAGQPQRHTYICPECKRTHVTTETYPAQAHEIVELVQGPEPEAVVN